MQVALVGISLERSLEDEARRLMVELEVGMLEVVIDGLAQSLGSSPASHHASCKEIHELSARFAPSPPPSPPPSSSSAASASQPGFCSSSAIIHE